MTRFTAVMFLFGTLCCSALASDPESVQVDRQELRAAAERFVREHPGFVPDLRPASPAISEQAGYRAPGNQMVASAEVPQHVPAAIDKIQVAQLGTPTPAVR